MMLQKDDLAGVFDYSLMQFLVIGITPFLKKGVLVQTKENLGKAIDLMRSINADGWVEKYEEELAGL